VRIRTSISGEGVKCNATLATDLPTPNTPRESQGCGETVGANVPKVLVEVLKQAT